MGQSSVVSDDTCIDCGEEPVIIDGRCRDCDIEYVQSRGSCRECRHWIMREEYGGPFASQHAKGCYLANDRQCFPRNAEEIAAIRRQ